MSAGVPPPERPGSITRGLAPRASSRRTISGPRMGRPHPARSWLTPSRMRAQVIAECDLQHGSSQPYVDGVFDL
jgi:hypothetical protein